jgi:hypothetical protein
MIELRLDLDQMGLSLESIYIRQAVARRWIVDGFGYLLASQVANERK